MTFYDGAALLGALAWIPYLIKLLRDIFTRPVVGIIAQRSVEIGFSSFGPILNLRLAFSVRNKDMVVTSVRLTIRHEGGEEKTFSWQGIIQRLGQMQIPQAGMMPFEKESSVLAMKLNEKEVEERFIRFQEDEYLDNKSVFELKLAKKIGYLKESNNYLLDSCLSSEEMRDLQSFIRQRFSWKQGKYTMIFGIDSPDSYRIKDNKYEFYLDSMNIELLEKNRNLIALFYEDQLKSGTEGYKPHEVKWNWAYPEFKKIVK